VGKDIEAVRRDEAAARAANYMGGRRPVRDLDFVAAEAKEERSRVKVINKYWPTVLTAAKGDRDE
jgi:hypothetical protein